MKRIILIVAIFLVFFLKLFSQTPNSLLFVKDIKKHDILKNDYCLSSLKYKGHLNPPNDTVYSGKNLFVLPEYESWLVWWYNYNYLSDNKIKPGVFHSPSLVIKYSKYTYKLSFQVAENISSLISASTNAVSFISLQASSDLVSSETKESNKFIFDSKVEYGKLKGKGTESYLADTINFQTVYDTFDINSTSLRATFLVGIKGSNPCIGLRFINYNTPAYQVGKRVPDPRNNNDSLLWADVKDTKFTHFFLVVDPLALFFPKWFTSKPNSKATQVNLQGHCYLMIGMGFAKNDTLGTVMTYTFPFQSSRFSPYGPPCGIELDLGMRITTRIGKHKNDKSIRIEEASNFRTAIGFRYTSWSIISDIKNDLQLRSNEFYWGPYLMVSLQL